jgi:hypothetical protein
MCNVFQYSVDKQNFRNKGETYLVKADPAIKAESSIKVARVKYNGIWDPEPFGWTRLATLCNNYQKVALTTETVEINQLGSTDAKIAHLTGASPKGGVLIVDSAGGSSQFSQTIEQEFDAIFGDAAKALKEPLPADHAIYRVTDKFDIGYRPFARSKLTGDLKAGRLRAIDRDGKPAVIYSPEDLSAGLVGQPVDGINGYDPATASRLMINAILYASGKTP